VLKRAALVFVVVFALVVVFIATRGGTSTTTTTNTSTSTTEGERESTPEGAPESEREIEIDHDHEIEETRPLVERLAEIRGEVHLLEMQRLDARARHDTETEARLDAEIAALRAQNDHLRGVAPSPEGI